MQKINAMKRLLHLAAAIVGFVLETMMRAAHSTATSDESPSAENTLGCALDVGVLNYRTERLDNGTDPYGWYEHH